MVPYKSSGFIEVFQRACEHVESDYIDRNFISREWPVLKDLYLSKITKLMNKSDSGKDEHKQLTLNFETLMCQLIDEKLTLSHSKFISPALGEEIDNQGTTEGAPDFLQASFRETDEYCYLKVPTMTVPLFSWKFLGATLQKLKGDKRPIVLDLRLNAGGAASAVGNLLAPFAGADQPFLTAKLANWESSPCETLYPFDEENNEGNCLDVQAMIENSYASWHTPQDVPFRLDQKVYVLLGERNYSCGEVFAQAMKEYECATLVGKTTAGAVVGGRDTYECGNGYRLMLPFVDMISRDGFIIEGKGVTPHVEMEFTTADTEQLTDEELKTIIGLS